MVAISSIDLSNLNISITNINKYRKRTLKYYKISDRGVNGLVITTLMSIILSTLTIDFVCQNHNGENSDS